MKKVIIVGAGAAGMMAAISAAWNGADVTVIERNKITGKKLLITGKGRCNVTNNCDVNELVRNVPEGGRFLYSAFSRFSSEDTMAFFEQMGVELKTERGNRVFPVSDRSADIVNALRKGMQDAGVKLVTARVKSLAVSDGEVKGVILEDGEKIYGDAVIIATGGMSYQATGSTGDGYELARSVGHSISEPKPSLIPLETRGKTARDLCGLSLRNIAIAVFDKEKNEKIYTDFGELLFTHFGLSGPVILSASAHMRDFKPDRYEVSIDLKPALDEATLDARVLRDFSAVQNRDFINSLGELLPKRMITAVAKASGIPFETKVHDITRAQRQQLCAVLKDFRLTVSAMRPIDEAIVTSGGVILNEIDPKTMSSKLATGLYFAGEVINADAYTGGFNLQIAFATGHAAGEAAAQ